MYHKRSNGQKSISWIDSVKRGKENKLPFPLGPLWPMKINYQWHNQKEQFFFYLGVVLLLPKHTYKYTHTLSLSLTDTCNYVEYTKLAISSSGIS